MRIISILAASALLATGAAYATDAPTAKPASTATAAAPDHHCRDNADAKKLAGAARKSFIKKCLADARAAK
jgi:psiF repeat